MNDTDIRVLVVDDDPIVRGGLAMMLGGPCGVDVVGQGVDGLDGVRLARELAPDVVLMDIRMPGCDGIEATARIRALPDPPAVIMLTTFDTDELVVAALRAGASGFLLKDTPPPRIIEALHRVRAGEPMLSPTVTARLIAGATAPESPVDVAARAARARVDTLTEREREVALAVGRGLTNAAIAAELYLSVATVKAHLTHLMAKLDATNRVQVAIAMHDAGLLDTRHGTDPPPRRW